MVSDIITTLALMFSIFIIWFQRRTIFELEKDIWELEKAYKLETNKVYHYKHRQFQLRGKNGGTKEKEQI